MKWILSAAMAAILIGGSLSSCRTQREFEYEMVAMGVGSQGSSLIKVYSYASSQDKAIELAKKNAVHGVLFKGIVGGNNAARQPAIVKNAEHEAHKDFFKNFFKHRDYLRFVSLSSDGTVSARDRMRTPNGYKIGIVVSVNKNDLRKYMEEMGIIKSLGGMFQ